MKNHTKRIIYLMVPVVFMVFGVTGCKDVVGDLDKSAPDHLTAPVGFGNAVALDLGTDISADVTTLPNPNTKVLDFGMVSLAANTTEIEGCAYVYKLDEQVPPDAEETITLDGFTGGITFKVTGNKEDGYNIEVTNEVAGYIAVIDEVYFGIGNNARKFTFDPWITFAGPLPAPINPSGDPGDISHTHFCFDLEEEGRSLDVSKTVVTSYTRTHEWDIDKKVETENEYELDDFAKIWLFIDGSGDEKATWTVDVTYEGKEDSDWNVSGVITIENIGTSTKSITAITDMLGGSPIDVDCGEDFELPYDLPVGETLTCDYDEDGYVEGDNVVTVTVEGEEEPYTATEPIVWGDPTTELYKTVKIEDISDLFGTKDLGSVTAPNDDTFTYDKEFAWADFVADDCGGFTYDNTATIVETDQDAEATLKVNVQCFIYDTAYAKSDDGVCFIPTFSNWGWTNPMSPGDATWNLWAGAAQCDTDKGTLVGSVFVGYDGDGYVTVEFDVFEDYVLEEYHVYVGTDMFPKDRRGNYTVAPGQYVNNSPFDGSDVYVIAHGVVGYPDPDFGP